MRAEAVIKDFQQTIAEAVRDEVSSEVLQAALCKSIPTQTFMDVMMHEWITWTFIKVLRTAGPDPNVKGQVKDKIFGFKCKDPDGEALENNVTMSMHELRKYSIHGAKALTPALSRKVHNVIDQIVSSSCLHANCSSEGSEAGLVFPEGEGEIEIDKVLEDLLRGADSDCAHPKKKFTEADDRVHLKLAERAHKAPACNLRGCAGSQRHSCSQLFAIAQQAAQLGVKEAATKLKCHVLGLAVADICKPEALDDALARFTGTAKDHACSELGKIESSMCCHQSEWCKRTTECLVAFEFFAPESIQSFVDQALLEITIDTFQKADVPTSVHVVGANHSWYVQLFQPYLQGCGDPFAGMIVKGGVGTEDRCAGNPALVFHPALQHLVSTPVLVVDVDTDKAQRHDSGLSQTASANKKARATLLKLEKILFTILTAFGFAISTRFEFMGLFDGTPERSSVLPDVVYVQNLVQFLGTDENLRPLEELGTAIKAAKEELGGGGPPVSLDRQLQDQKDIKGIAAWVAQELYKRSKRTPTGAGAESKISLGALLHRSLNQWATVVGGVVEEIKKIAQELNKLLFLDGSDYDYRDVCSLRSLDIAHRHVIKVLEDGISALELNGTDADGRNKFVESMVENILRSPEVGKLLKLAVNPDDTLGERDFANSKKETTLKFLTTAIKCLGYDQNTGQFGSFTATEYNRAQDAASMTLVLLYAEVNANMCGMVVKSKKDAGSGGDDVCPYTMADLTAPRIKPEMVESTDKTVGALSITLTRHFSMTSERNTANARQLATLKANFVTSRTDIQRLLRVEVIAMGFKRNPSEGFAALMLKGRRSQDLKLTIRDHPHIPVPTYLLANGQKHPKLQWNPHEPDLAMLDPLTYNNETGGFHVVVEAQVLQWGTRTLRVPTVELRLISLNGRFEMDVRALEDMEEGTIACFYDGFVVGKINAELLHEMGQGGHLIPFFDLRGTIICDGRAVSQEQCISYATTHGFAMLVNSPHPDDPEFDDKVNVKFCPAPHKYMKRTYLSRFKDEFKGGRNEWVMPGHSVVVLMTTKSIRKSKISIRSPTLKSHCLMLYITHTVTSSLSGFPTQTDDRFLANLGTMQNEMILSPRGNAANAALGSPPSSLQHLLDCFKAENQKEEEEEEEEEKEEEKEEEESPQSLATRKWDGVLRRQDECTAMLPMDTYPVLKEIEKDFQSVLKAYEAAAAEEDVSGKSTKVSKRGVSEEVSEHISQVSLRTVKRIHENILPNSDRYIVVKEKVCREFSEPGTPHNYLINTVAVL